MRHARVVRYLTMVICLSVSSLAQDQFVGRWQARISPASGKHSITVNIIAKGGEVGGTLVFVDGIDGSETESPITNPERRGRTLKFETNLKSALFTWDLTIQGNGRQGRLHGSYGHMVIDERVVKEH